MAISSLLALSLLIGCDQIQGAMDGVTKGEEEEEEEVEEVVEEEPEAPPEQKHGAPAPLEGKTLAEICGMNGLALVKFSYDELKEDFAGKCCGPKGLDEDNPRCKGDWPFGDGEEDCDVYDRLREDMIAQFGYPFRDPEVQARYDDRDWYEKREDYNVTWLPNLVKRNAAKLKKAKEACE